MAKYLEDIRLLGGTVSIGSLTSSNTDNLFEVNGNSAVYGTFSTTGLKITTGASNGYVLTSDASGNATWEPNNDYLYATFSIESSEILTMGGTAINLLSAPGSNEYYNIKELIIEYKFGTTGYTFSNINLEKIAVFMGGIPYGLIDGRLISNQDSPLSGDRVVIIKDSPISGITQSDGNFYTHFFPVNKNVPLSLKTLNGEDPQGGDGELFIKMLYKIETFFI